MPKCVFDKNTVNEQLIQLSNLLESQRKIKKTLLSYLEKVSDYISNTTNTENSEALVSCLSNVQEIFDNIKSNIDKAIELKLFIENISKSTSLNIIDFEKYYNQFIELSEQIENTNNSYNDFMEKLISIPSIDFSGLNYKKTDFFKEPVIETIVEKNVTETESIVETTFEEIHEIEPTVDENLTETEPIVETTSDEFIEEIHEIESTVDENVTETEPIVETTSDEFIEEIHEIESTVDENVTETEPIVETTSDKFIEEIHEIESTVDENLTETEPIVETTSDEFIEEIHEIESTVDENVTETEPIVETTSDESIEEIHEIESTVDENLTETEPIVETTSDKFIEEIHEIESTVDENVTETEPIVETTSEKSVVETKLVERTLIIDNKAQIAVLPYSLFELEEYFSENPEKYSSINDIIEKEYTVSLNNYENTSISRFKQTFKLAKQKSNLSFFESLNYANKLLFENQVEPIIIASCYNINELEVYLDCLNNDVLNSFKCFTIINK